MKKLSKKDVKKELEELQELVGPIFQEFIGSDIFSNDYESEIIVKKEKGYIIGKLCLDIPSGLIYAEIEKSYCVSCEDHVTETYCGADTDLKIILRWFDWDDDLVYTNSYYPNMDNDVVAKKFKAITTAAENLAEVSWSAHKHDTEGDANNG